MQPDENKAFRVHNVDFKTQNRSNLGSECGKDFILEKALSFVYLSILAVLMGFCFSLSSKEIIGISLMYPRTKSVFEMSGFRRRCPVRRSSEARISHIRIEKMSKNRS